MPVTARATLLRTPWNGCKWRRAGSLGAEPGPATRQRARAQGATAIHLLWLCALCPTDPLCGVLHLMSLH